MEGHAVFDKPVEKGCVKSGLNEFTPEDNI